MRTVWWNRINNTLNIFKFVIYLIDCQIAKIMKKIYALYMVSYRS